MVHSVEESKASISPELLSYPAVGAFCLELGNTVCTSLNNYLMSALEMKLNISFGATSVERKATWFKWKIRGKKKKKRDGNY